MSPHRRLGLFGDPSDRILACLSMEGLSTTPVSAMRIRQFLIILLVAVTVVVSIILIRTFTTNSNQLRPRESTDESVLLSDEELWTAATRVSGAIQTQPVTFEDEELIDPRAFASLFDSLTTWYPAVHRTLTRELVGDLGLLYTWKGAEPAADALVLASHLDVVPVPPSTLAQWEVDPFAGEIKDGYVWGRGAIDDKSSLIGILEAVEALIEAGYQPERTVYLAFGGDEERGGFLGAGEMALLLRDRGVRAHMVVDEGLFIVNGMIPGVDAPVALIGVAEKGAANIELSVSVEGGHGSMPNNPTALGLLSSAISRLENSPLEPTFSGVPESMFGALAPEMSMPERMVFNNLCFFGSLVMSQLAASPSTNALIRTTIAPTMLRAGTKANVLPTDASALLNVRLRPGDTVDGVVKQLASRIDDERVRIRVLEGASEPSAISPLDSEAYTTLAQSLRNVFPEALTAPALMIARTDGRHYASISDNIFRITPLLMTGEDLKQVHGVNERLSIEGLGRAIQFYGELIRSASSKD